MAETRTATNSQLIWFQNKIQPNRIDDIIKAEFPNPEKDPDLYRIQQVNNLILENVECPQEDVMACSRVTRVGRVYSVHPKNAECFIYVYSHYTLFGAQRFENEKAVNSHICETYPNARQRLGLLENDNHWESAVNEAALTATANQIREPLAITLATFNSSNPN
ncbi:hypothetical protein EVAR_96562_1 [Eumeta japonica]|uniref:Uncharacterized protein n=1 Tax=Eumeta variegata TaxID=151549 RepID=A0A4C1WV09_EUMVA|nr:hypothetical protein EVAR_96562_1 [Eumeta japonica]